MKEDELDNVAGGTGAEIQADGQELVKRRLLSSWDANNGSKITEVLNRLGYKYNADALPEFFGGKKNEYFNKNGESVSREEFWEKFDDGRSDYAGSVSGK